MFVRQRLSTGAVDWVPAPIGGDGSGISMDDVLTWWSGIIGGPNPWPPAANWWIGTTANRPTATGNGGRFVFNTSIWTPQVANTAGWQNMAGNWNRPSSDSMMQAPPGATTGSAWAEGTLWRQSDTGAVVMRGGATDSTPGTRWDIVLPGYMAAPSGAVLQTQTDGPPQWIVPPSPEGAIIAAQEDTPVPAQDGLFLWDPSLETGRRLFVSFNGNWVVTDEIEDRITADWVTNWWNQILNDPPFLTPQWWTDTQSSPPWPTQNDIQVWVAGALPAVLPGWVTATNTFTAGNVYGLQLQGGNPQWVQVPTSGDQTPLPQWVTGRPTNQGAVPQAPISSTGAWVTVATPSQIPNVSGFISQGGSAGSGLSYTMNMPGAPALTNNVIAFRWNGAAQQVWVGVDGAISGALATTSWIAAQGFLNQNWWDTGGWPYISGQIEARAQAWANTKDGAIGGAQNTANQAWNLANQAAGNANTAIAWAGNSMQRGSRAGPGIRVRDDGYNWWVDVQIDGGAWWVPLMWGARQLVN